MLVIWMDYRVSFVGGVTERDGVRGDLEMRLTMSVICLRQFD